MASMNEWHWPPIKWHMAKMAYSPIFSWKTNEMGEFYEFNIDKKDISLGAGEFVTVR
jgi:hypothetical protein